MMSRKAAFFTIVPAVLLIVLLAYPPKVPWSPLRVLGLVLMVAGLGLLTVARVHLGNSFSITPQATALVTNGLYAKIRNPVYVFSTIGIAGLLLYIGRPELLWLLVPLVAMQMWRARAEARVLEARFGDEYRRYRAQTWF